MSVIKRDGRIETFNADKIVNAAKKAYEACSSVLSEDVENQLRNLFTDKTVIGVEDIQDAVEKILMKDNPEFAKAFIIYRYKHQEARYIEDRIKYMNSYINSTESAASASETDANANVTIKNVANLEGEVYKTTNRIIQRKKMKTKLKEMFPEVADNYEKDLNHHIIYVHDEASSPVLKNYCEAVSLYPLLTEGVGTIDGITPSPPNNLDAFCGQIVNLAFLLSAQCKGAVAFGGLFVAFNLYCVKEWGEDYYLKENTIVTSDCCKKQRTIKDKIEQAFQAIVYGWNQPAGNRSYQSPFTNVSYYDSNYYKALFEDFYYPDGTQPKWEAIDYLQKLFMRWFNKERTKTILTFPVETMALLSDDKDIIDKDYKDFTAEMYAEGHSFFTYISSNPNGLSSCCFSKDTKVLWKSSTSGINLTTLEELHNLKWEPYKKNLKIFHNGSWIRGKSIKLSNRNMYKVVTHNNKTFVMTDNHINITLKGEKETKDLSTNDYLMFNTLPLQAIHENDEHLTYSEGVLLGAYLGDGTISGYKCQDGSIHSMDYSLNEEKYNKLKVHLDSCASKYSMHYSLNSVYNNVYPVKVYSKEFIAFIQKWGNWVEHTTAISKDLNLNVLSQSYEFRKGILDGWYITDGGNSNRCYTVSPKLKDAMEVLITSLGYQSIIDISDRTDETIVIRGESYNRNYPLYCIRWYKPDNHRVNKDKESSWIKQNNSIYFKIKSIEKVPYSDPVYCIECTNTNEPYFTLPSGLITHNCRLRSEIEENVFSFTNGLSGIQTGSCNVITLNINRIIQDFYKNIPPAITEEDRKDGYIKEDFIEHRQNDFKNYLIDILERIYKYHIAYKTMLYELEEKGMFTSSNAGYIHMNKLYSTIGINGLNEAALFLGIPITYNADYMKFVQLITETISEQNKLHSTKKFKFNQEFVPAEGLSSKNFNWDVEDGYWTPNDGRVLYNSYIYDAHDNTSVLDKFRLHGKEFTGKMDGGVGCHVNLEEHLTKEQYLKLIDYAIKVGNSYFTFNIPNTQCDDCKSIYKYPLIKCPKCGSTNMTQYTRVIGFMKSIKNFDHYRYIEANQRTYSKNVEIL